MNCPHCHAPTDTAARFCGQCGKALSASPGPEFQTEDLNDIDLWRLPYPVALTAQRVQEALEQSTHDIFKTLAKLKDCFEASIKFLGTVLLVEYCRSPQATPERSEELLQGIVRPSLGVWVNQVVGNLSHWLIYTSSPAEIVAALFARSDKGSRPGPTPLLEDCRKFVTYRKDGALGHGAVRSDTQYRQELAGWLPVLHSLLDGVSRLANWRLCLVTDLDRCQVWMGHSPSTATETGYFARKQVGHFVLRGPLGEAGQAAVHDLYPFVCYLPDPAQECRLHFYESVHRYQSSRKEADVLEYDNGWRHPRAEPVAGLEEAFTADLLAKAFKWHRGRMAVIEGRVASFGEILETHADIVGRRWAIERVQRFIAENDRGLLVIEAQPGKGKTALMAHLIEEVFGQHAPRPVHFFYRRTAGLTNPDVCVKSLYHALLESHDITESEESRRQTAPDEVYNKLVNLLCNEIAPRLLPGRPQLIFIDALDEADREAIARIPENLQEGMYVITSTRPVFERVRLARREFVHWLDLDDPDLLQENLSDGFEYVQTELADSNLPQGTLDEVARVGAGNFLVIKLLCQQIGHLTLSSGQVGDLLRRLATDGGEDQLSFIYAESWERLTDRCTREDVNLLCEVAGVLVTAHSQLTADIICGVLGLRAGDWDFALRRLVEYLAPREYQDDGASETFYRIYHESFADFVRARMAVDQRRLLNLFADYCLGWPHHAEGYSRRYVARFGLQHCHESGRQEDAARLALQIVGDSQWEHLAELVGAMHQIRTSAPILVEKTLALLHKQSGYRARLVLLVYSVWRMPTVIAAGAGSTPQLDKTLSLLGWVMELVNSAIRFSGMLAAADYLHQEESAVQGLRNYFRLRGYFRRLATPTLGDWAGIQQDYYTYCTAHGIRATFAMFESLGKSAAKSFNQLQNELINFRNKYSQGLGPTSEQAEQLLDWLMSRGEHYFQIIEFLAEGRLLVLRDHLVGEQGRFQVFAGPNPLASSTVDLPCPPAGQIGEVFFSLGDSGPVSLFPFVLTEAGPASPGALLLYDKRLASGEAWQYYSVGWDRKLRVNLQIGFPDDFDSACRTARAEWQRSGRPPTTG